MKLLNDIKQLVASAAAAIKAAARRAWQTATALLRRLRTATTEKAAAIQNAAATWWQSNRTQLVVFAATYALVLLFAVGVMVWTFSLERQVPEVKDWVDALFAGRLILPGWQLAVSRTDATPTMVDLSPAAAAATVAATV
ncbi:MAG: hypothetical protein Kow0031_11000 [Anaerolineae bacterium]